MIMFRFHCKKLLVQRRDLLFNPNSIYIRSISSNPTHDDSFTVSYLVDSCGLSHAKAVSVSKKVQFETPTKPDSVLTLFRDHDFTNIHISKIIPKLPKLLLSDAAKTLKPKLEFFNSIGLSGPDLTQVISKNPRILMRSLENRIRPAISLLKAIFPTDSDIITVIKHSKWILGQGPQKVLAPNIALLRTIGVPDDNISKLVRRNANTLLMDRFSEVVEETKKMKFNPSQYKFIRAIDVLSSLSKSSWDAKCDIFKNWGWSEKEIRMAFRNQPVFMSLSEKNIMSTMEFLVNKMGYDSLLISKTPDVLHFSLEKRTIPRISVIKVLVSNGLVKKTHSLNRVLRLSDKLFLEEFVMKFEETIPELRNVFQGKMNVL